MGLLVVGPDHGGATETIRDGETGFLFKHGDAADLARKLDAALDLPADEKRAMTERAMRGVRDDFSKTKMCEKTLALYREVAAAFPVGGKTA